ncbi:hypothetical protein HD554DRAFT_1979033, partial [Boletus coccyginus]
NHHFFTTGNLNATQSLLDLIVAYEMNMALLGGIPTLKAHSTKNLTCPNNIFCSTNFKKTIIKC